MKFSTLISLAAAAATTASATYINYTTVTGYFLQDEASTNATTFVYVCSFSVSCRIKRTIKTLIKLYLVPRKLRPHKPHLPWRGQSTWKIPVAAILPGSQAIESRIAG